MTLHDIRLLANILKQAEPGGYRGKVAHDAWEGVIHDVAQELRKRRAVTDHRFNEAVFIEVALGHGEYALFDEAEDDRSWDVMASVDADGQDRVWSSPVMLAKERV